MAELSRAAKRAPGCLVGGVLAGVVAFIVAAFVMGSHDLSTSANTAGDTPPAGPAPVSSAPPAPAQMLDDLDGDTRPVGDYQSALDALTPKCTQDEAHIAALGDAGYSDLVKNGVADETRLSVLQHVSDSIPASMGRTDCASVLSAYLVLREQG